MIAGQPAWPGRRGAGTWRARWARRGAATWRARWRYSTARLVTVAALLGAGCVAWAAVPTGGAAGRAGPAVTALAAVFMAGSACQLALATVRRPDTSGYPGPLARLGARCLDVLRRVPWAEAGTLAVLALEALHPARPWHTALLGAALTGYLFAVHLAESTSGRGEEVAILRSQAPVLAAGLGLLVLAAGSALLPGAGTGPAGDGLRAAAAVAAALACALALPV
ncbi:MAG TPA: hypothetical protein VMH35_03295 [Streptosporangiaceae bacterium]|nr:hypothetical protein [Streptosporangiaceae bacterium]